MILNKTTIILSVMEIFIFVWKTSKQAVTDTQNQNLHSNESFLIKKNNSHSSSLKENWAHLLQVLGVWGVGFYYYFFFISPIHHYSVKFLLLWGRNAAPNQETHQRNPTILFFFRIFPRMNKTLGDHHQYIVLQLPSWVNTPQRRNVFLWELELAFSGSWDCMGNERTCFS